MEKTKYSVERYLNETQVRSLLKHRHSLRVSSEYIEELNYKIFDLIDYSAQRAKANKRSTVFDSDI